MNHFLSIKARVALWYAIFIVLGFSAFFGALYILSNNTIISNTRSMLITAVEQAVDDIDLTSGTVIVDPGLDYNMNGADIVLYSDKRLAVSGMIPDDFPKGVPFRDEVLRTYGQEKRYFVYDRLIENEVTGNVWVRGVISADMADMAPEIAGLRNFVLLALPILLIIAIIGGAILTNRAFMPLREMVDTAESIAKSGKLSRRIPNGNVDSKDEMVRAAGVINGMLDRVEEAFNNEKQFTDDASHELRTPTAVIMAQSEYALDNTDDKEEVTAALRSIHTESKKMDLLVSQLLTLARSDNGRIELAKENTDISLLAEEACIRVGSFAREKNITVHPDCEEGTYMDADPVLFGRIYDNLLTNAVKYGKEGGNIWVTVRSNDGRPTVTVRDDGIGIDKEAVPHIFERFYREEATTRSDSFGLGLSIVKLLVDEHGGKIACESSKDVGTVFRIRFDNNRKEGGRQDD